MNKLMIVLPVLLCLIGCISENNINQNNINQNDINQNSEYELIKFTDFEVINSDLELIEGRKFELLVKKDGTVFINDTDTIIQNDYDSFYVVDIDNDNIKEVITRTTEEMISPITNKYHIYKYFADNDEFYEVVTIPIMGTIDSFYIDGDDIKVEYHSYESADDYIEEKHYQIKIIE